MVFPACPKKRLYITGVRSYDGKSIHTKSVRRRVKVDKLKVAILREGDI